MKVCILKMKRKSISKIVRLLLNNQITMNKARFITGLSPFQLKALMNARIANNSYKAPFTIYQCLVTTRNVNVDVSKVTKDLDGRLCVSVLGRPTPIFKY